MRPALLLLVLVVGLASCRSPVGPTPSNTRGLTGPALAADAPSPATPGSGSIVYDPPELGQVPVLGSLRTELRNGALHLTARLIERAPDPFYSASAAGGWCLQWFVDTDQAATGYWQGYDYIVDGADHAGDAPVPIRGPIPECCDWGPVTGYAGLDLTRPRVLALTAPLADLGGDDGETHWALTLYATVPCAECPDGISAIYADTYFGSSGANGAVTRVVRRTGSARLPVTLYQARSGLRAVELPWPRPARAATPAATRG